ncbi:DUF5696 domain-containing protein [Paenibacillus sp. MMS20-IR301]|uniref:DUF5696 domain-containing protein n=1 Tax=Paenibacillus sp. MMS20-IR301 TaxID=2895946 RepID=UPI0028EEBF54|nr:DUF5696 domain-containing protein [Paenibacillus sp. MMS20-IR301]WNS43433.1 DUF5696 domain-containing protein [Paenibacillus sp. MMS20-IR301]
MMKKMKLRGILLIVLVLLVAAINIPPLYGAAGPSAEPSAAPQAAGAEAGSEDQAQEPAAEQEAVEAAAPASAPAEPAVKAELQPVTPGTKALENDRYILYVDEKSGNLQITDKQTGKQWLGSPQLEKTAMPNVKKYTSAPVYARYTQGADITQIYPLKDEDSSVKVTIEPEVVRAEFAFASLKLSFALEYRLTDSGFEASIPEEYLKETGSAKFTSIEVLPFFHAAREDQNGAMLLPDGSGALLEFRENHPGYLKGYSEYIYGGDETFVKQNHEITDSHWLKDAAMKKAVALPVFGIYQEDTGYLAIVTKGETDAKINGVPSGIRAISLYRASSEFTLRKDDVIFVGTSGQIPYYQGELIKSERAVRYVLLQDEEAGYVGMAKAYRNYLLEEEQIKPAASGDTPLYLQVLGGISRDEVIGSTFIEMSTFKQIKEMIDRYYAEGVSRLEITVSGWSKDGLYGNQPDHFPVAKQLGGSKGLKELQAYAAEKGVTLYLKANYVKPYQESNGVKASKEAVRGINREVLKQYIYYLSSGWNTDNYFYLLKPEVIAKRSAAELDDYQKLGTAGVQFDYFGSLLYSDEDNKSLTDRKEAERTYVTTLDNYRQENIRTAVDYGYAYTLGHVDRVDGVPLDSSGFVYTDRSIPFYQLVVHGLVPYTASPVNLLDDSRGQVLRALEYGALPSYELTYAKSSDLQRTLENRLFSSELNDWLTPSAKAYLELKDVYDDISGQQMMNHEELQSKVFRTTYAGGVSIIINYNNHPVGISGQTVEAYSYAVTGG